MRSALLIFLLWLAGLGAAAQFAKMGLIFPELAAVYPGAGASLGWLVSLVSVLGAVLGLFAGLIAVRIGLRRLLLAALALGAASSFAQAALPSFGWMLLSRVVEGASHLGIVVVAPTLIAQLADERWRGFAMTLWGTFFGVAFALVAWLGLPLVAAYGPDALFVAHGAALAAVAVPLALMLPRVVHDKAPFSWAAIGWRHVAVYRSPRMGAPAAGWLFYTITYVSLATVLPGTVPAEARGFVAGAMPIASIVSSLTLGVWLLRRTSAVGVIVLGFALAAVLAAALAFAGGSVWLPVALFAALGLVQGASFAAVPELNASAEGRANANGGMAQMGNLGNGLGTPVLLALLAAAGFSATMLAVAATLLGGLFVHLWLARRRVTRSAP